jgi:hypothetical protein
LECCYSWSPLNKDLSTLNEIVEEKQKNGADVRQLWDIFKKHLFGIMNNNIPNKEIKSLNNIPWLMRFVPFFSGAIPPDS